MREGERKRERGERRQGGREGRKEGYFGIFTEVTKYNYLPNKGLN